MGFTIHNEVTPPILPSRPQMEVTSQVHFLPKLCPATDMAPLKSGFLSMKRAWMRLISFETVSMMVWQYVGLL